LKNIGVLKGMAKMMIETTILEADSIACFKVVGKFDVGEMLAVMKDVYPSIERGVVWDFSECDLSQVTIHEMRSVAQGVYKYAKHHKSAGVGRDDLKFGILRMYETYAEMERVPPIMRIFRNADDALNWLRAGEYHDDPG
jgi:hypothetical protein